MNTASDAVSSATGSVFSWTPRTVMPDGSRASRTRVVYAVWSASAYGTKASRAFTGRNAVTVSRACSR